MTKNLKKIILKKRVVSLITIIISLTMSALIYNMFLLKLNIVSGGINGVSIILKHLFKIDQNLSLLLLSIFFLIINLIFLGKEKTKATLAASLLYPLLVKLTQPVSSMITFSTKDMFIVTIFAGLLSGVANGLMYKTGYNAGGLNVISQILYEKFHIPISKSVLTINIIIIGIGGYFFGSTKAMYAIILIYINSLVMDKVLLGTSKNKAFYIITTKDKEISDYIINSLGHSVTTFDVKGGYLDKKRKVLLTVIPSREYFQVTEGIKLIDKNTIFMATDSYEVVGAR